MIIGISGKIGSGKDTVGMIGQALTMDQGSRYREEVLQYLENYPNRPNLKGGFKIKKFADKLKEIVCMLIGCTR